MSDTRSNYCGIIVRDSPRREWIDWSIAAIYWTVGDCSHHYFSRPCSLRCCSVICFQKLVHRPRVRIIIILSFFIFLFFFFFFFPVNWLWTRWTFHTLYGKSERLLCKFWSRTATVKADFSNMLETFCSEKANTNINVFYSSESNLSTLFWISS